ncbi:FecR family protein [Acinetobacter sp.]|uniref:FecR family protein n=1 Tax=Acinetobacter sp. TaxID=472 RepID=UPI002FC72249
MDHKKLSRHAKAHSLHDIQRMLASFEDDILPNIASKDEILQRARQRQLKKKSAGASAFAVCAMLLGAYWYNPAYQQYDLATVRGEQASIRLRDGSRIMLNTDTHVQVQERLRSREITLSRGEAGFHVAHAQHQLLRRFERSFQVSAGEMLIIDIGTVFNVQKHSAADASVTVLEGEVAIGIQGADAPLIHLSQGQSLSNQQRRLNKPVLANLDAVQAWQTGHIVFDRTPLHAALQNFQRYADFNVQIQDAELKDMQINGQFKIHNYQHFMQILPYVAPVRVEKTAAKAWKIAKK